MTEEEMAVDWIRSQGWNEENLPSDELLQMKKAFLAGLKAGSPKWHKVADGDLPKPNIAVLIGLQFEKRITNYIAYYRPSIKKWQLYNLHEAQRQPIDDDYIDSDEVIEWCEIPTYTDE